ncbi:MAG: septum formation protein Maf [Chloroflexi bacterium]|nr:septum formation protein Maf [Chloroflexota bacterium]
MSAHDPRPPFVLASASPRRRALLASLLDAPFQVRVADIDESPLSGERPEPHVRRLALAKARAVAAGLHAPLQVLGADTVVAFEGRILGKPASPADAVETLRRLRGRRHEVITGLALVDAPAGAILRVAAATTGVWMRAYTDAEIEAYVASGDPMDKAGAYAIQHTGFRPVARLEGSETNVIGLPLGLTRWLLGV